MRTETLLICFLLGLLGACAILIKELVKTNRQKTMLLGEVYVVTSQLLLITDQIDTDRAGQHLNNIVSGKVEKSVVPWH